MQIRRLMTVEEFHQVYELEREIWGYTTTEDSVPVPIMIVSAEIGGLLLGAFEPDATADRMVGFAYALPGVKDGKAFQWSHMLGVTEAHRNSGLGWRLKLEQRRLVLESGLDLIKWTYDPLQALNAHLNFVKLGVVAREYHENVYGDSSSPLHVGTPTDRFIAEWWLESERVAQRLAAAERGEGRPGDIGDAAAVNLVSHLPCVEWIAPGKADLSVDALRLAVTIPMGFTEMQQQNLPLAQEWRATTREIFTTYLPRGYEVVDFVLDRPGRRGTYLLERTKV
ncbi:MAG TPA: hypothetical protein VGK32_13145 [Vicinamibacterales bacterium]